MTDFPRHTVDGDAVGKPRLCDHKFRVGECPRCDLLTPPPPDFRELVQAHKPDPEESA